MIESLFAEIAEAGWLVSNLFQRDDGLWQCNLRSATHHTGFGIAESPAEAIESAIDQIASATETPAYATCATVALDRSLADLFKPKITKITRRL